MAGTIRGYQYKIGLSEPTIHDHENRECDVPCSIRLDDHLRLEQFSLQSLKKILLNLIDICMATPGFKDKDRRWLPDKSRIYVTCRGQVVCFEKMPYDPINFWPDFVDGKWRTYEQTIQGECLYVLYRRNAFVNYAIHYQDPKMSKFKIDERVIAMLRGDAMTLDEIIDLVKNASVETQETIDRWYNKIEPTKF